MHAAIEFAKKKSEIFVPQQWATVIRMARRKDPYMIVPLKFGDILGVPYPFDLQPIYFFAINIFFPEFHVFLCEIFEIVDVPKLQKEIHIETEDISRQKERPCQLMQKWYHPI
jgi:hypothetical protein